MEIGLVQAHGIKKGRTDTVSPTVYRDIGQPAAYVRQAGFDSIQQEQMALRSVHEPGEIARGDVIELCKVSPDQAPSSCASS